MSDTESRAHYAEGLHAVTNDREEVVLKRAGDEPVVVSLDDHQSLGETSFLMRSPANARRLLQVMERLEGGRAPRAT